MSQDCANAFQHRQQQDSVLKKKRKKGFAACFFLFWGSYDLRITLTTTNPFSWVRTVSSQSFASGDTVCACYRCVVKGLEAVGHRPNPVHYLFIFSLRANDVCFFFNVFM